MSGVEHTEAHGRAEAEAEERERQAAERERQRIEREAEDVRAAEACRAADEAHRDAVHAEIVGRLCDICELEEHQAALVCASIRDGLIDRVSIRY